MKSKSKKNPELASDKKISLTKRVLISATKSGIQKAAKDAMRTAGFVVKVENGWLVKEDHTGKVEKIKKVSGKRPYQIALD